jgi:hypothetical protein
MGEENRIEYLDQKGYRSLGKMLQGLFVIPFGPGALLKLRPLMTSCTSTGVVNLGSLARVKK